MAKAPLIVGLLLAPALLTAGDELVGTTSAAFLKLGSGARPAALGEAYVGLADDAGGLAYNPAGMAQNLAGEIQATHTEWFRGLRYEDLNGIFSLAEGGTLGASLSFLTVPQITRTEQVANTPDPSLNYREIGNFSPFDLQLGLAYARPLWRGILGGLNLKLLSQSLDTSRSFGLGLDLGFIWPTPVKGLNLGLAVQNLGTPIKIRSEAFNLPLLPRLGVSWRTMSDKVLLLAEADMPTDNDLVLALGAEYNVGGRFFPRLGWRFNGIFNPWSAGFGLQFEPWILDMSVVPFGELGLTYRASLSWRFGRPGASLDARVAYASSAGKGQSAVLSPNLTAPSKVKAWGLYIYDSGRPAKVVRTFGGQGPMREDALWDARDAQGQPVADGVYWAILSARYLNGQTASSKYVKLEVSNTPPAVDLVLDSASLNVQAPGEAYIPAGLRPSLKSGRAIARWRMEILDPQGQIFRSQKGEGELPALLVWDGKNDKGEALISGLVYSARLWVQDALGAEGATETPVSFKAVFH